MHASLSELVSLISGARITAPASFVGVSTNSKKVGQGNLSVSSVAE